MASQFMRAVVSAIAGYTPGEQPQDRRYIKLNTNENPYPPSPRAIEAVRAAATDDLRLYPDPLADPKSGSFSRPGSMSEFRRMEDATDHEILLRVVGVDDRRLIGGFEQQRARGVGSYSSLSHQVLGENAVDGLIDRNRALQHLSAPRRETA